MFMNQSNDVFDFSADRPLESPEYDRLGMKLFAENLAECITKMHSSSGIVIGLHGSWGSGKSTVLNFVKHYLENQTTGSANSDCQSTGSIRTIDFNPWWFSEDEDLVRRFIWSLIAEVGKEPGKGDKLVAGLKQFVAAAETLPGVGDYAKPINFLIRTYGKQPVDFYESKGKLEGLLRNQTDRFVVFVDDVDRLAPREVCQVLRLVKSVADFFYTTPAAPAHPAILASWSRFVDESSYTLFLVCRARFAEVDMQIDRARQEPCTVTVDTVVPSGFTPWADRGNNPFRNRHIDP